MPRVLNQNNYTVSTPHHQKKGDTTCHISKNAQSVGLRGILKQIFFTRMKSDKFFYRRVKVY